MKLFDVFEVFTVNVDVNDGTFTRGLYSNIESAIDRCLQELEHLNATNIVEDFKGELLEYDGGSLEYRASKGLPAVYYRSHYGNYRMVVYVKTRNVHS